MTARQPLRGRTVEVAAVAAVVAGAEVDGADAVARPVMQGRVVLPAASPMHRLTRHQAKGRRAVAAHAAGEVVVDAGVVVAVVAATAAEHPPTDPRPDCRKLLL